MRNRIGPPAVVRSIAVGLLVVALLVVGGCATTQPTGHRPPALAEPFRVLLLGDSISIGYTPVVEELLAGRAEVVRPRNDSKEGVPQGGAPENCAGTTKGVAQLDRWLAIDGGDWDVIHFNFGLHDLKRVQPDTGKNSNDPGHPHQAGPEQYREQLRAITQRLKGTGARLVFATTTPVPEGDLRPYREPEDSVVYNRVASEVMAEEGAAVNDLFAFVANHPDPIQRKANVHFTREGSRALGERVADSILESAGYSVPARSAPRVRSSD